MGLGSYFVTSPRKCFSTEDYNEWLNMPYHNNDDDDVEKIIPTWFYLPYCDEYESYREFKNFICSHHRLHRILITCSCCQNDFKTFSRKQVRCSSCCRLNECKLKTYTFETLKKLANVYNIKRRRQCYIIDELLQKVEKYSS